MCWNENISLNTFIFTSFVILFILYNNTYTQYKLSEFNNYALYFFLLSLTTMQLVEYYLWISIRQNDPVLNRMSSILGWILIRIVQPLATILLIPYTTLRNLSFFYFLVLGIVYFFKEKPVNFKTTVDKDGHLKWLWLYGYETVSVLYILIVFTLFLSNPILLLISIPLLIYSYIRYDSWGSVWCSSCNIILLYYLIKLLFILPYHEYNLC